MTAFIVFVVLVAALGAAAYVGWLPDSRDTDYGLGKVVDARHRVAGG